MADVVQCNYGGLHEKDRRKYDAEFKLHAVQMVVHDNMSCREVERDLVISHRPICRCVKACKIDPADCFPVNGNLKSSDADIKLIVKENRQLRKQRDILKP
ncbi:MAG: hypothetical protein GF401_07625 [Chitinivibrionales bacterium]|nr:hypothetical protein [Chitinivibrionales bacterium]